MSKVVNIGKAREKRTGNADKLPRNDGFQPCSPDMTICGDCERNREKDECPRLKEWLEKKDP